MLRSAASKGIDMTVSLVLRQVRLIDPGQGWDRVGDVWLDQGRIRQVGFPLPDLETEVPEIMAPGWVVAPGLVDLYGQPGEPGFEQRETLASLSAAALAGGFTRVGVLPTTDPVLDQVAGLEFWQKPRSFAMPRWGLWAAYSLGAKGSQLSHVMELAAAPVVGFGEGRPLPDLALLRRLGEFCQLWQKPLLVWPRWSALAQGGVVYEGEWALRLGLPGIPALTETGAVALLLEWVRHTPAPIHLMRISQARSVELLATAPDLPVTASTSWMHLIRCDQDIERYQYDAALRLDPPLGSDQDRQALRRAVASGSLMISTDHTPFTFEEKMVGFEAAPPGAIGLELALPLLWQELVVPGILTPLQLWSALSFRPATVLGDTPPGFAPGSLAELVVFAPDQPWIVDRLHSLSRNTLWWGETIQGRVVATLRDGLLVSGSLAHT
ncbi:MAG: dihydroorotase [Synechococcales cyanobacterium]